jgi:hypothetical protein
MKDPVKAVAAVIVAVLLILTVLIYIGYHRGEPGGSEGDPLRTDRQYYIHGETVVFTFRNVWDEPIYYDSELRDTLSIYDSDGKAVVVVPRIQNLAFVTLQPNETLEWEWDQTYYLYKVVDGRTDWDPRTGTQVPPGIYKGKVMFEDISASVTFRILP